MSDPSEILFIEINIPKSSKFAKNQLKILTSETPNIPSDLKKNFNSNVIVHYNFGQCNHSGSLRQSGDLRDHIILQNGQPIQSLDIKLKDGNILNAVRFKLLIPGTRNGLQEILASLIFRNLGFIAPETSEVQVSVNGIKSLMLFQEKTAKELLERNHRREGPIFEGDESIWWANENSNFNNGDLAPLSLSRLINKNWFKKGETSQAIVLNSYSQLQQAYMQTRSKNFSWKSYHIFPNYPEIGLFVDFHNILFAMNGMHALLLNNRQYYYNAIEAKFEPIYYDGNVSLNSNLFQANKDSLTLDKPSKLLLEKAAKLNSNNKLLSEFLQRVINDKKAESFYHKAIKQFQFNLNDIEKKNFYHQNKNLSNVINESVSIDWYKNFQIKSSFSESIISDIYLGDSPSLSFLEEEELRNITIDDLANILSRNTWNKKRVTYIPSKNLANMNLNTQQITIGSSLLKASIGMGIDIDEESKSLTLEQKNPSDWALIMLGDYSGWKINFKGKPPLENQIAPLQRFNNYGLTGCLTIYQSTLDKTSFSVDNGGCEDSLNIIGSRGEGLILDIQNANADAVDLDYSNLKIKKLNVINAGNDCFDVSGGNYSIEYSFVKGCSDKGISVGEKSSLVAKEVLVEKANIAISAKDFSRVNVSFFEAMKVSICAEAKRKKQEFGGAKLLIDKYKCSANFDIDGESKFVVNHL